MDDTTENRPKHPGGRPSKYRKEYCQEIIKFFDRDLVETREKQIITKDGVQTVVEEVPCRLPTIEAFATYLGVTKKTLWQWEQEHPEFLHAVERAKAMAQDILVQNALARRYAEGFAKFVGMNYMDMRDKSTQELTGRDGGPIETRKITDLTDDELLEIAARGRKSK